MNGGRVGRRIRCRPDDRVDAISTRHHHDERIRQSSGCDAEGVIAVLQIDRHQPLRLLKRDRLKRQVGARERERGKRGRRRKDSLIVPHGGVDDHIFGVDDVRRVVHSRCVDETSTVVERHRMRQIARDHRDGNLVEVSILPGHHPTQAAAGVEVEYVVNPIDTGEILDAGEGNAWRSVVMPRTRVGAGDRPDTRGICVCRDDAGDRVTTATAVNCDRDFAGRDGLRDVDSVVASPGEHGQRGKSDDGSLDLNEVIRGG